MERQSENDRRPKMLPHMVAAESYRFLVNELNGYVAVFTANGSLYEFTDIRIKDLDNILKKQDHKWY